MPCRHHDVQIFDDIRCCLACGETVFDSTPKLTLSPSHEESIPYRYAPLNYALGQEIRLVIVFPGTPSDHVAIDIVHVNLTDNPTYEAVSYAWATQSGDASLSQVVYCRGRTIAVTKHCEAALRCFRRQGRNRTLWIDAISIDQTNISERNHQVAFMGNIYSNASQVIIYLGPGTDLTDIMLSYLNGDSAALGHVKRSGMKLGPHSALNHALREFLQLRWLDRAWVLQEVALAKLATMTAGNKTVPWTRGDSVETLLKLCKNMSIEPPSALNWLPASEPHDRLLTVLHKSRNCSSSDPRDKVFAVLGLAHPKYQQALPVDYSQTPEEVFTKVAIHLIEEEKDLDILKYTIVQDDDLAEHKIPSWSPRWDLKAAYDPLPPQFTASELDTLQSIWFSPHLLEFKEDRRLVDESLLSKMLESISDGGPIMTTEILRQGLSQWLTKNPKSQCLPTQVETIALALTQRHAQGFHSAILTRETLAHHQSSIATQGRLGKWPCLCIRAHRLDTVTRVAGRFGNPLSIRDLPYCVPCKTHAAWGGPLCQQVPSVAGSMYGELTETKRSMGRKVQTHFYTAQSVGFTEVEVRAADEIWALDGADVPFVLRKVDQHYVLIGECYLYRALRYHLCKCCGCEVEPWKMTTEIIDIW